MKPIKLRTQYRNITFAVFPDGRLLLNGVEVGRMFPDEYFLIAAAVDEAGERLKEAA